MRALLIDPVGARGHVGMPSVLHGVPEAERAQVVDDLVQYLQSLGGPFEAEPEQVMPSMLEQGRRVWDAVGCFACHEQLDLHRLAGQTSLEQLESFLLDPLASRPSGHMPSMHLDPAEARAIAAWLLREQSDHDAMRDEPGLITERYEIDHEIRNGDLSGMKPASVHISDEVTADLIDDEDMRALRFRGSLEIPDDGEWSFLLTSDDGSWLWLDGQLVVDNGGVHAPATKEGRVRLDAGSHAIEIVYFELAGGEMLELEWKGPGDREHEPVPGGFFSSRMVTYMPPAGGPVPDRAAVSRGERSFVELGCAACHVPGIPPGATSFIALSPGRGCLDPTVPPGVPDYGFDQVERDALDAVVSMGRSLEEPLAAAVAVDHAMLNLNCYACHVRDGLGGPDAERNPLFTSSVELGDEARLPPDLTGVGNKLHEAWIHEVFEGARVRPYMRVRMPEYGAAIDHLPGLLHDADAVDGDELAPAFSVERAEIGHRLVGIEGFKCIECHSFDGHESLGEPGVDLVDTVERLRPGWFRAWLLDPPGMRPGTRMPAFFASEHAIFPDILEGDARQQIDAIWNYLSLGPSMPIPAGVELDAGSYALAAVDEPVLFGTFMEDVGPRTIAVGFPERAHVAWDGTNDRMALVWRGDFMDARGTWHQRAGAVQSPAGSDVLELPSGPAVARLASPDAEWPLQGGEGVGIRRDADRVPHFVTRQDGLEIIEHAEAFLREGGSCIRRGIQVDAPQFESGIHFRAAVGDSIIDLGEGRFAIDDELEIVVLESEGVVREQDGRRELLIPIRLRQAGGGDGRWTGTARVEVIW